MGRLITHLAEPINVQHMGTLLRAGATGQPGDAKRPGSPCVQSLCTLSSPTAKGRAYNTKAIEDHNP